MAKGRPVVDNKPDRASINIQVLQVVKTKLRELHTPALNSDVAVISHLIEKEHERMIKSASKR